MPLFNFNVSSGRGALVPLYDVIQNPDCSRRNVNVEQHTCDCNVSVSNVCFDIRDVARLMCIADHIIITFLLLLFTFTQKQQNYFPCVYVYAYSIYVHNSLHISLSSFLYPILNGVTRVYVLCARRGDKLSFHC